jgi:hypothetical protein
MAEQITLQTLHRELLALRREVRALLYEIKKAVVDRHDEKSHDELELTDWAKKELAKARAEPTETYTPLEKVKQRIARRRA